MSLFALISTSLSSSMIQPASDCPAFTPSTTTTPTPSPSSCTTKWIICAFPQAKGKILLRTFARHGALEARFRIGRRAVRAAPFPRRHGIRIAPQAEPARARAPLRGIEGGLGLVERGNPRHAAAHLLRVDVDAVAGHAREQPPVA